MPSTPVVSNTSPLINLAGVGRLDLLPQLYTDIWIPEGNRHHTQGCSAPLEGAGITFEDAVLALEDTGITLKDAPHTIEHAPLAFKDAGTTIIDAGIALKDVPRIIEDAARTQGLASHLQPYVQG